MQKKTTPKKRLCNSVSTSPELYSLDSKMETDTLYPGKFWIFEEKRFASWEDSQAFYSRQADTEKDFRARHFIDNLTEEQREAIHTYMVV